MSMSDPVPAPDPAPDPVPAPDPATAPDPVPAPDPAPDPVPARRRVLPRPDDRAQKGLIAIAMAVLTCLATGVGVLQSGASTAASVAQRAADQLHHQADAEISAITAETSREYLLYRTWYEQGLRAETARQRATAATDPAEAAALGDLADTEAQIQFWLQERGALFAPPYYDAAARTIDFAGFSARASASVTRLGQQAAREDEVASAHAGTANEYVTVLTVIAVALFFLGLGTTLARRRRAIFVVAGLGAAIVAIGMTVSLAERPVHRVPDAAIEAYVRSSVALNGLGLGLDDTVRARLAEARTGAREAVSLDPSYRAATRLVADVALTTVDRNTYEAGGDPAAATGARADAIAAYGELLQADPSDVEVLWSLGYLAYLGGDAQAALSAADSALQLRPGTFPLEVNRSLALLALGRGGEAADAADSAIADIAGTPMGEAQWFLAQGDVHLARLIGIRPAAEREALAALLARIREASVSLHVLGTPVAAVGMPAVTVRAAGTIAIDRGTGRYDSALFGAANTATTAASGFMVDLVAGGAVPATATLSIRVWVDGREDASFRTDVPWAGDGPVLLMTPYGAAGFKVAAGAYRLELYLDGAAVGSFAFTVAAASG